MRRAVAFDLGSTMAYSWRDLTGLPATIHQTFAGDRVTRANETLNWLLEKLPPLHNYWGCEVLVYERPFVRGMHATRSLWGIAGLLEAVGRRAGMVVLDATPAEIKKFAVGKSSASKEQMLEAARRLGYTGDNEHEADAFCLLKYSERYVV